ncbi:hypothetical protein [Burkholderia sp. AU45388]|uniref:hypothetical protein n=1 Tax=Burkholderia sp. AU45388 TaxID=3059206 RepID=UPI00264EC06D|nr:hypothetical protein [Burkholderia sp. AU45388]MDN7425964.1 hypothetical protein [Burkholderia sp. AU45388]
MFGAGSTTAAGGTNVKGEKASEHRREPRHGERRLDRRLVGHGIVGGTSISLNPDCGNTATAVTLVKRARFWHPGSRAPVDSLERRFVRRQLRAAGAAEGGRI